MRANCPLSHTPSTSSAQYSVVTCHLDTDRFPIINVRSYIYIAVWFTPGDSVPGTLRVKVVRTPELQLLLGEIAARDIALQSRDITPEVTWSSVPISDDTFHIPARCSQIVCVSAARAGCMLLSQLLPIFTHFHPIPLCYRYRRCEINAPNFRVAVFW